MMFATVQLISLNLMMHVVNYKQGWVSGIRNMVLKRHVIKCQKVSEMFNTH